VRFGRKMRELRKARKWGQADLAVAASVSESLVRELEAGRRRPTIHTTVDLVRALDLSVEETVDLAYRAAAEKLLDCF